MSPTIDPLWLAGLVSFVREALLFALYVVGLVVSLRRWTDRGRSARFAAAGFGISLLGDLSNMAMTFVNARFIRPPGRVVQNDYDLYLWPMLAASSLLSLATLASTVLILLALWFEWRDADTEARRDRITRELPPLLGSRPAQ